MYVRMYVCMYVCTYVCMYVCMYIYIYIYKGNRSSKGTQRRPQEPHKSEVGGFKAIRRPRGSAIYGFGCGKEHFLSSFACGTGTWVEIFLGKCRVRYWESAAGFPGENTCCMSRSLGLGRLGCMGFWGSECSEHGMSLASSFLELLVPDPQDPKCLI